MRLTKARRAAFLAHLAEHGVAREAARAASPEAKGRDGAYKTFADERARSPEFARERIYAERASRLLGTVHQVFTTPEDDFLRLLVDTIRLSGLPARHPQPILYNLAYRFPAPCFITGEFGDQLFGLKPTESYVESFERRRWLRLAEGLRLRRLLPRGKVALPLVTTAISPSRGRAQRVPTASSPNASAVFSAIGM